MLAASHVSEFSFVYLILLVTERVRTSVLHVSARLYVRKEMVRETFDYLSVSLRFLRLKFSVSDGWWFGYRAAGTWSPLAADAGTATTSCYGCTLSPGRQQLLLTM